MKKWDPDGNGPALPVVVLAGGFTIAGTTFASSVATWNGTTMGRLGTGIQGYVIALEIDRDGMLIAAGSFPSAGGVVARNLARWDGALWSEIGGGTDDVVQAIAIDAAGNLVAGGDFLHAGGDAHTHVARWTGSAWQAMGTGIPGAVVSLARGPGNTVVAVAHPFNSSAIRYAWNWTGTQWVDITAANVQSLTGVATLPSGDVMMVGPISTIGPDTIRRWNGTTYISMGLNSNFQVGPPKVLADGGIYVLGVNATSPSGHVIRGVAQFINNDWIEAAHIESGPSAVEKLNDQFLMGGNFTSFLGEFYWDYFAYRENGVWKKPDSGFDHYSQHTVCSLSDNRAVVSGYFTSIGNLPARHIAIQSGRNWSAMGEGLNDLPKAIVQLADGTIVAGGLFTASGLTPTLRVARWNGTSWQPMGSGFNNDVNALAVGSDGTLYAGGAFTFSGGASVNRVARWNGSAWTALGSGIDSTVLSLAVEPDGTLLAGGLFTSAGGSPASHIAAWTGFSWSSLGSGCDGAVNSILVSPVGEVIIGGGFNIAGGFPAACVARWDGAWSQIGGGLFGGQVKAMTFDANGQIVAAGNFLSTPGRLIKSIARLDGTQWNQLGDGISGDVRGLARMSDGRIVASGEFSGSGTTLSRDLAFFGPGTAPEITTQPASATSCPASSVQFHIGISDGPGTVYRWRKDDVDISIAGNPSAATDTLRLMHLSGPDAGEYTCRVSNDCGERMSDAAVLTVCSGDFNCDTIVDLFDYLDFVAAFSALETRADFNADGIIDFFDYLDFVQSFSQGC